MRPNFHNMLSFPDGAVTLEIAVSRVNLEWLGYALVLFICRRQFSLIGPIGQFHQTEYAIFDLLCHILRQPLTLAGNEYC